MKAFTLKRNGGIENLVLSELPVPGIKHDEVLIKSNTIGLNRVDPFVRQHEFALDFFINPSKGDTDIVLGWDVSGRVESVGAGVTSFKAGDEVFGMINFKGHGKTNAEFVAAPAKHLALKPKNITHNEAAAAGLAALTAWQAIVQYGKVKKGEKVLIHAAAGGVGHYAIQIAKYFGAYVIGTGSDESRNFILDLGADEFIDYAKTRFEEIVHDADLILESQPGDHVLRSVQVAKIGGRVISLLPYDDKDGRLASAVTEKQLFTHNVVVRSDGDQMNEIARLMAAGKIRSHISKVFAFHEIPLAHTEIERGKTKGKIVIEI